ncbi:class I SAM-dependent methyltransferase [Rhizobiaceae bacterium CRRU44]|uniref:Class I SAM-dependent methyltransferase n=1 Tax=Ferranicluibacter rubi TaxID=2715133 RepID=A0AA43ZIA6_9HYPH|nr:class I SAM-dependent methyltransferase [Ferranicluibacter rubi]NHT77565.1 class I SAM-dependent methyltransferase [Ferranicluibacter rubi]
MNPNNPYPHEIAFDPHVWLPSPKSPYRPVDGTIECRELINGLIAANLALPPAIPRLEPVATSQILTRLSDTELQTVRTRVSDLGYDDSAHAQLAVASHEFPELIEKLRTSLHNPPDHIHRMQRGSHYIGDLYNADLVVSTLKLLGLDIEPAGRYLDFGCSSGSLIRALAAYSPTSDLHGADPIKSSIEWCRENVRGTFSHSQTTPPLAYPPEEFNGVTAISIWSHLGQSEALAWFDEIHRVTKASGWLLFTASGHTSVRYFNDTQNYPRRVLAILEGFMNSDFVFEETYVDASPEGLSAAGYGNAYFSVDWVKRNLLDKWEIVSHSPGANQGNQDVYLMSKKSSA